METHRILHNLRVAETPKSIPTGRTESTSLPAPEKIEPYQAILVRMKQNPLVIEATGGKPPEDVGPSVWSIHVAVAPFELIDDVFKLKQQGDSERPAIAGLLLSLGNNPFIRDHLINSLKQYGEGDAETLKEYLAVAPALGIDQDPVFSTIRERLERLEPAVVAEEPEEWQERVVIPPELLEPELPPPPRTELDELKELARTDPKRVAEVLKIWLNEGRPSAEEAAVAESEPAAVSSTTPTPTVDTSTARAQAQRKSRRWIFGKRPKKTQTPEEAPEPEAAPTGEVAEELVEEASASEGIEAAGEATYTPVVVENAAAQGVVTQRPVSVPDLSESDLERMAEEDPDRLAEILAQQVGRETPRPASVPPAPAPAPAEPDSPPRPAEESSRPGLGLTEDQIIEQVERLKERFGGSVESAREALESERDNPVLPESRAVAQRGLDILEEYERVQASHRSEAEEYDEGESEVEAQIRRDAGILREMAINDPTRLAEVLRIWLSEERGK